MSAPPVLVETVRSGFVESRHRGSVVVLSPSGEVLHAAGDVVGPVLPRSCNKLLQAVGLLELGWQPDDEQLALAAASHSGEPEHLAVVRSTLAAAGLDERALQCPPDLPLDEAATERVLRSGGGRERILMNCSGKHAGMLAACVVTGQDPATYRDPESALQQHLRSTVERLAGEPVAHVALDGCGAPQHALSLTAVARAYVRIVEAAPGTPERRVADAVRAHPDLVGGTGREATRLMRAVPGAVAKDGAEAALALALPGRGAVAVKIEDGGWRAAPVALVAALQHLPLPDGVDEHELAALAGPPVRGGGEVVGRLRPAG